MRRPVFPVEPTTISSTGPEQHGYLAGLRDPQIGRALTLMLREPERNWQVASLAKAVGMSRSAFAARFAELLGKPVMGYLTELRLRLAWHELRHGTERIASLAARYGYQSEVAFSRAFKRAFGAAPSSIRPRKAANGGPPGRSAKMPVRRNARSGSANS